MTLCAFDLLYLDGRNVMALPLLERKAMLEQLLAPLRGKLVLVGHLPARASLFEHACWARSWRLRGQAPCQPLPAGRALARLAEGQAARMAGWAHLEEIGLFRHHPYDGCPPSFLRAHVNRSLTLALTLIAAAAALAGWWQYAWKPAMVDTVPRNEPLALSAMEHVRRVLFEPTATFNGVRYFEATKAACGEVTWHTNSRQPGGHTFFVAYPGGFVRLARDMAPEDFLTLVKRDCPDRRVERAATEVVYRSQQPGSKPKAP